MDSGLDSYKYFLESMGPSPIVQFRIAKDVPVLTLSQSRLGFPRAQNVSTKVYKNDELTLPFCYSILKNRVFPDDVNQINTFHLMDQGDAVPYLLWLKLVTLHQYMVGDFLMEAINRCDPQELQFTQQARCIYATHLVKLLSSHGLFQRRKDEDDFDVLEFKLSEANLGQMVIWFNTQFMDSVQRTINSILGKTSWDKLQKLKVTRGRNNPKSYDVYMVAIHSLVSVNTLRDILDRLNESNATIVSYLTGLPSYLLEEDRHLVKLLRDFRKIFLLINAGGSHIEMAYSEDKLRLAPSDPSTVTTLAEGYQNVATFFEHVDEWDIVYQIPSLFSWVGLVNWRKVETWKVPENVQEALTLVAGGAFGCTLDHDVETEGLDGGSNGNYNLARIDSCLKFSEAILAGQAFATPTKFTMGKHIVFFIPYNSSVSEFINSESVNGVITQSEIKTDLDANNKQKEVLSKLKDMFEKDKFIAVAFGDVGILVKTDLTCTKSIDVSSTQIMALYKKMMTGEIKRIARRAFMPDIKREKLMAVSKARKITGIPGLDENFYLEIQWDPIDKDNYWLSLSNAAHVFISAYLTRLNAKLVKSPVHTISSELIKNKVVGLYQNAFLMKQGDEALNPSLQSILEGENLEQTFPQSGLLNHREMNIVQAFLSVV